MIFDTGVLIWASRGNRRAARTIDAAADRALSIVSLVELFQGARSKLEARQIRQSLRQLQFRILLFPNPLAPPPPVSSSSTPSHTAFNSPML